MSIEGAAALVGGSVAARAAAGLVLACLAVAVLLAVARIAGERWPLVLPAIAMLASSLLAWQALLHLPRAAVALSLLLGLAALAAALRWRPSVPSAPSLVAGLALALLLLNAAYAAFPVYRYDQWNDHLVVAKALRSGPLTAPVLNDHLGFTGTWEYLFSVPRALWGDDLFNQSAVNAFSWIFLAVGLYGQLSLVRERVLPAGPSTLLLLVWLVFSLPDEPGLMNAKPDPVLWLSAIALLQVVALRTERRTDLDAALLGFYLLAPVGLKLTWLHFCAAALPAAAISWRTGWTRRRLAGALLGVAAGASVVLPYALKNLRLFGNPLHPLQTGPFRSWYWSDHMTGYWQGAMLAARSADEYVAALARLPLAVHWSLWGTALPVLLAGGLAALYRRSRAPLPVSGETWRLVGAAIAVAGPYLLLWPFFYAPSVDARFVAPGLAALTLALVAALLVVWSRLNPRPRATPLPGALAACGLLLPALLFGQISTKATRMARWGGLSADRFMREGPAEWQMFGDGFRAINAHRRVHAPGAGYGAAVTLSDVRAVYPLDGGAIVHAWEFEWFRERSPCLWAMLIDLDVRYVFARTGSLTTWPEVSALQPGLVPLEARGMGNLIAPGFLAGRLEADPACHANRGQS